MPYRNALYSPSPIGSASCGPSPSAKRPTSAARPSTPASPPIKALGTTDQHSQVQLYREGPNDKVFGFVEVVEDAHDSLTIPVGLGVKEIQYLEGKRMADLLAAEKRATEYALVESQRPNFTITFPRLDEHHVGQFIYLWEVATAYAGLMLNINTYDQPAVELGKQATFGLMGRAGFEKHLKAVERTLGPTTRVIGG